jgi:uncharacterized protein (DUF2164 family)
MSSKDEKNKTGKHIKNRLRSERKKAIQELTAEEAMELIEFDPTYPTYPTKETENDDQD